MPGLRTLSVTILLTAVLTAFLILKVPHWLSGSQELYSDYEDLKVEKINISENFQEEVKRNSDNMKEKNRKVSESTNEEVKRKIESNAAQNQRLMAENDEYSQKLMEQIESGYESANEEFRKTLKFYNEQNRQTLKDTWEDIMSRLHTPGSGNQRLLEYDKKSTDKKKKSRWS